MNNNMNHFDDEIEILDDFEDQPKKNDLPIPNDETRKQVDETVRAQLSAFSNQRLYNNSYNVPRSEVYGYDQPRTEQPISNNIENHSEPEVFEVEDIFEETPDKYTPIPEAEDIFAQPVTPIDYTNSESVAPVRQAPEMVAPVSPVETMVEKPTPLERTTELLTVPELEKTAVYPSGVVPIPKNEPVDDSDKNSNKSTKALMFIIGLFVLLALVIFIVLPLVNPV